MPLVGVCRAPELDDPGNSSPPRATRTLGPRSPELVIGCPVLRREWILKRWWRYALTAAERAGFPNPEFIFVGDPIHDPDTWDVIDEISARTVVHAASLEEDRGVDRREWNWTRYERMVQLRNTMLTRVRELAPKLFLSLDSDVLLHPDALRNLSETLELRDWAAVGGKTYMSALTLNRTTGEPVDSPRSRACPSWAFFGREGQLKRSDSDLVFPVDVIMAIKLMTPAAYEIDYENHRQGEDAGWSTACFKAGLQLGWDGRVTSKHVMEPEMLDLVDPRAGF